MHGPLQPRCSMRKRLNLEPVSAGMVVTRAATGPGCLASADHRMASGEPGGRDCTRAAIGHSRSQRRRERLPPPRPPASGKTISPPRFTSSTAPCKHRVPPDTVICDLQFRFRCSRCRAYGTIRSLSSANVICPVKDCRIEASTSARFLSVAGERCARIKLCALLSRAACPMAAGGECKV
jgi:hypothetical protein